MWRLVGQVLPPILARQSRSTKEGGSEDPPYSYLAGLFMTLVNDTPMHQEAHCLDAQYSCRGC